MPVLTGELKKYVVRSLARFNSANETVRLLASEFGVVISKQAITNYRYDPSFPDEAGVCMTAALRKIFIAERRRFIEDLEAQPMAHKTVRLDRINKLYEQAQDGDNPKLAARALGLAIVETKQVVADGPGAGSESDEIWKRLMAAQAQALAQALGGENGGQGQ
jgi:hypothetical protein